MINPSNVIDLAETLLDRGEANFALCPHCGDHSSFAPIVRRNRIGNYITALLCLGPKCKGSGVFLTLNNGYIIDTDHYGGAK